MVEKSVKEKQAIIREYLSTPEGREKLKASMIPFRRGFGKACKTSDLALDQVVEWLDMELISVLRNIQGEPYLKVWCETEKQEGESDLENYYILQVSDSDLEKFLAKELTLKGLIASSPAECFEVRKYEECRLFRVETFWKSDFPSKWIPTEDSYHDPSLRLT